MGSKASFAYTPSTDEVLDALGVKDPKERKHLESDMDPEKRRVVEKVLVEEEVKKPYVDRKVQGDASETGLVKFV